MVYYIATTVEAVVTKKNKKQKTRRWRMDQDAGDIYTSTIRFWRRSDVDLFGVRYNDEYKESHRDSLDSRARTAPETRIMKQLLRILNWIGHARSISARNRLRGQDDTARLLYHNCRFITQCARPRYLLRGQGKYLPILLCAYTSEIVSHFLHAKGDFSDRRAPKFRSASTSLRF